MTGPAHFILYVADQTAAAAFWTSVLDREPSHDSPGMTEFTLNAGAVLGLMPESGITALLGPGLPDPGRARGIPRSEVYLVVDDAAYCVDPNAHVVAFAERPSTRVRPSSPSAS